VILAAAAVVAREKGSDRGYNPHSSLKNQVDSICVLISRVVDFDEYVLFKSTSTCFMWDEGEVCPKLLKQVWCKKRPKIVPDQLLVWSS
jgi:hypothetical protein